MKLVPDEPLPPLSVGDARDAAKAAFGEARDAQVALVSHLYLTQTLYKPGKVSYYRLKGLRNQAKEQVDAARAVLDALDRAITAMERAQ